MPKSAAARTPLPRAIADEVRAYCLANANPERAQKYAKFFVEGYDAYGLDHKNPSWDENKKSWAQRLRAAGPEAFLDAGDLLVQTGKYEEASFAIVIAAELKDLHTPEAFERLGKWFDGGIRNWGHTDVLCGEVLSRFLIEGIVGIDALTSWRDSGFKFRRRAAPVMLINYLDHCSDCRPLLSFLEPLMADTEKVVRQGMGWFLREAWKRQPKPVEAFLLKHRDTAPRLIFQYATEKMSANQRARYKRKK